MSGTEVNYPLNEEVEVPMTEGGLFKTVLVEGKGRSPVSGAKVTVHYVGTLESDGSKFDSSRDRDDPFVFTIGQGQVIQGWDKGVATMTPGEKAVLRCLPDFGYGENGSPPKIPGGSTLKFEVELLSWSSMEDLYDDGMLMKQSLGGGSGSANPAYESECKIDVVVLPAAKEDEDEEDVNNLPAPLVEKKDWDIIIGETENLPVGLERVIEKMKNGEEAIVTVKGAIVAFDDEAFQIKKGTSFRYHLTLTTFLNKAVYEYEGEAKLEQATVRKTQGNQYYAAKNWGQATRKYRRALEFLDEFGLNDELKEKAAVIKTAVLGNLSQVLLNNGSAAGCIEQCDAVLDIAKEGDAAFNKALFRRAKALSMQQEWEYALEDLNAILSTDPNNADVQAELSRVAGAQKALVAAEKKKYAKLFA